MSYVSSGSGYTGRVGIIYIYGVDAADVRTYAGFSEYTPVATLRPCIYGGRPGLWHVEGNKFYGNTVGAGSLSVANA